MKSSSLHSWTRKPARQTHVSFGPEPGLEQQPAADHQSKKLGWPSKRCVLGSESLDLIELCCYNGKITIGVRLDWELPWCVWAHACDVSYLSSIEQSGIAELGATSCIQHDLTSHPSEISEFTYLATCKGRPVITFVRNLRISQVDPDRSGYGMGFWPMTSGQ